MRGSNRVASGIVFNNTAYMFVFAVVPVVRGVETACFLIPEGFPIMCLADHLPVGIIFVSGMFKKICSARIEVSAEVCIYMLNQLVICVVYGDFVGIYISGGLELGLEGTIPVSIVLIGGIIAGCSVSIAFGFADHLPLSVVFGNINVNQAAIRGVIVIGTLGDLFGGILLDLVNFTVRGI